MTFLKVQNASKTYQYDTYPIFDKINFELNQGETASIIMGKFGGKTTLAKILTGVEKLSCGSIIYMDKPLDQTPAEKRQIAFVSVPSIFDKGKVICNVAYGLKVRGFEKKNRKPNCNKAIG